MLRFLTFVFVLGATSGAGLAGLISEADLVGDWKIASSTFKIRELATPNPLPRPQLPTNYTTFALTLRKDGTFLITNAPTGFFIVMTSENGSGKWSARTNWPARLPLEAESLPRDPKEAYIVLNLDFDSPKVGGVSSEIGWSDIIYRQSYDKSAHEPSLRFGPFKDKTQSYEWEVLVTKQKGI